MAVKNLMEVKIETASGSTLVAHFAGVTWVWPPAYAAAKLTEATGICPNELDWEALNGLHTHGKVCAIFGEFKMTARRIEPL